MNKIFHVIAGLLFSICTCANAESTKWTPFSESTVWYNNEFVTINSVPDPISTRDTKVKILRPSVCPIGDCDIDYYDNLFKFLKDSGIDYEVYYTGHFGSYADDTTKMAWVVKQRYINFFLTKVLVSGLSIAQNMEAIRSCINDMSTLEIGSAAKSMDGMKEEARNSLMAIGDRCLVSLGVSSSNYATWESEIKKLNPEISDEERRVISFFDDKRMSKKVDTVKAWREIVTRSVGSKSLIVINGVGYLELSKFKEWSELKATLDQVI